MSTLHKPDALLKTLTAELSPYIFSYMATDISRMMVCWGETADTAIEAPRTWLAKLLEDRA